MINKVGMIIVVLLSVFYGWKWVSAQSPCSVWAEHPEQCSSDHYGDY